MFLGRKVELEEHSIYFAERAGIAGIVVIDLDELWTFIPE